MGSSGMVTGSGPAQRSVQAVTSGASFMVALDALVVSTALSTIRTDLGASIGQCVAVTTDRTGTYPRRLAAAARRGPDNGPQRSRTQEE
jgi:hypothetical protein